MDAMVDTVDGGGIERRKNLEAWKFCVTSSRTKTSGSESDPCLCGRALPKLCTILALNPQMRSILILLLVLLIRVMPDCYLCPEKGIPSGKSWTMHLKTCTAKRTKERQDANKNSLQILRAHKDTISSQTDVNEPVVAEPQFGGFVCAYLDDQVKFSSLTLILQEIDMAAPPSPPILQLRAPTPEEEIQRSRFGRRKKFPKNQYKDFLPGRGRGLPVPIYQCRLSIGTSCISS